MEEKKKLELYVHIPFCVRKCAYCDFVSGPGSSKEQENYVERLLEEIERAERALDYRVVSVFFGGGTPSILNWELLDRILKELKRHFLFAPEAEITLEANPGTVNPEKLSAYRGVGFNRISFGCQSVHDEELKRLGRIHTFQDFRESYSMARKAGFQNINVDLMSGLPGQTCASFAESLNTIARMEPEHISVYSLIIEPGTPFANQKLDLPDEDTEREMYEMTGRILGDYGFLQYEISNYAKPGYACIHNKGYWERTDYLGFGPSAASLYQNRRWTNTRDQKKYMEEDKTGDQIRTEQEILSEKDCMEEFMFLGLRMTEGVSRKKFSDLFGKSMESVYGKVLEKYERLGMLAVNGDRVALSRAGISVSNVILSEFLL
ncbi:MAG: radical SAM family heme chaperone HemW [Fusicatenibacter sp.]|nr:radical SAM family heme chaperone HemW [Lachnospiraceae bacterium]MDY2938179.1 radical SAM family heme chaperone HemW [Fusicatenibacter sp.]